LVIIWLKRCLTRSLIEPALESAPVGLGVGVGVGDGVGLAELAPIGVDEEVGVGDGLPDGFGFEVHSPVQSPTVTWFCADANCIGVRKSKIPATSVADPIKSLMRLTMISARTAFP
jgi:hypothetical protein